MAIPSGIDQAELAEVVTGLWEDWQELLRDKHKKWGSCIRNYLVDVETSLYDRWPWRSQVADTLSQETADTIAANLSNGLFPINEKYFTLHGEDELGERHVTRMQGWQESHLQRAQFIESVRPALKQLAVIGNCPYIGRYDGVRQPVKRRIRMRNPGTNRTTAKVVKLERPAARTVLFEPLDAFDVAFDPTVLCRDDSPFIWRMIVPKAKALRMGQAFNWSNMDQLEELKHAKPQEHADQLKKQREAAYGIEAPVDQSAEEDEVELLWLYGDVELESGVFENQVVVIANRDIAVDMAENEFWAGRPLGWMGYDRLWQTAYEKGPLEALLGTQSLVNTFQNQKADILNLIIMGAFAYVDDGVIDPDALFLQPGGFVEVGAIENLKALNPNQNVALAFSEIDQLRSRAERSSGSSRFEMGQAPGGRRTAFEANLIRAGGSSRSNDILKHVANSGLEVFLAWHLGTLQQMKWGSREMTKEALLGQYRVQYSGADLTVLRNFQIQNLLLIFQVVAQSPEAAAAFKMTGVARQLARALSMDDEEIVNSPEEMETQLRRIAQRQAQARRVPEPGGGPGEPGGADEAITSLVRNAA